MGPRSGVPDGVRARHCVILDGIVPPFLVLLWLAALLAVRRIAWSRPGGGGIAPPRRTDVAIAVLVVALGAALLLAMGRPPAYQHGPVRLWSGNVQRDQNSQQLADPYKPFLAWPDGDFPVGLSWDASRSSPVSSPRGSGSS
jgi:hypothetical protein